MKLNEDNEDDILNDVNNLFINDESDDDDYEFDNGTSRTTSENDNSNFEAEPIEQAAPIQYTEPDLNLLKAPVENPKESTKESPVVKDKIPEKVVVKQSPIESPPSKETPTPTPKDKKDNKPEKSDSRCKNNSDCDSNSFCITKTGKCTAKFELNQSGCTANDQCSDSTVVCYSKTCMLACRISDDSACKQTGYGCSEVKDLKLFQGMKGQFNGVCDKVKSSKSAMITNKSLSKPSVALISASAVILLTLLIIAFVYLRGYLKRRHRNTNPDMFLFNKLQRSASQSLAVAQRTDSVERLNARLSSVGGARFTRWAALTNENTP